MCYICRVRFLCSVYSLVHHCSARHLCALGPWRDVVLAPLSITLRLSKPCARCAGGGVCCSCWTPSLQTHIPSLDLACASMTVTQTLTAICHLNGAFRACVLYLGPSSLHDLYGSSFLSQCCGVPTAFNNRRQLDNNCAGRGEYKVVSTQLMPLTHSQIIESEPHLGHMCEPRLYI